MKKTRNQKIKARAKKGSQVLKQNYLNEVQKSLQATLTEKEKQTALQVYEKAKTSRPKGVSMTVASQASAKSSSIKIKRQRNAEKARNAKTQSSFSAGGAGDAYTWRFASTASNAFEIVRRLGDYMEDEDISNIVAIANKLINYSTSDTYDYDTIKYENQQDIRELMNAVEKAKHKFNDIINEKGMFEEYFGDMGEDFTNDEQVQAQETAREIFDVLDQLQSVIQELDDLTTDTKIPNQMGGLSAVGGSLSVDIF